MDNVKSYGFVYCWTNVRTGKKYIGSHYGSENDGYIASSKHFLPDYYASPADFNREILDRIYEPDVHKLRDLESSYLKSIPNLSNNPQYYNRSSKASGWEAIRLTKEELAKGGVIAGKKRGKRIQSGIYTEKERAQYDRRKRGEFTAAELSGIEQIKAKLNAKRASGWKPAVAKYLWRIEHPDGQVTETSEPRQFCEAHGLLWSSLSRASKAFKTGKYKGFSCHNMGRIRT